MSDNIEKGVYRYSKHLGVAFTKDKQSKKRIDQKFSDKQ